MSAGFQAKAEPTRRCRRVGAVLSPDRVNDQAVYAYAARSRERVEAVIGKRPSSGLAARGVDLGVRWDGVAAAYRAGR
jgi:hypothetical protein